MGIKLWISEILSLTPKCLRCLPKEPLSAHLIKMNFQAKQVTRRYAFIASVLVIAGLAVLGRASYIMVVKKDFWMAVNDRFTKENDTVPPTRGNILADNGEVLAASLPEYKLYMDFMSWEKDDK